ncbi:MAG: N-acetyltransferase [Candidatus Saccharibacteria bacterium]|nr:N-acetyltransferase [Candidatus Saccharibacteria bacterium]
MSFGPIMRFTVDDLHIELAPITKEVLSDFISPGMNQATISRFLASHTAKTIEDEEEWYEATRKAEDKIVWGIWLIENDKRTLIGNSALEHIEINQAKIHQAISGSMIFRQEFWGRGIASAAHKARTWYAFHEMGMHRITSAVIHGNGGSLKALKRSGYDLVYVERNTVFVDGKIRHQDNLECLNPEDPFWSQWWHGERPTKRALEARKRTREALAWASENVTLI